MLDTVDVSKNIKALERDLQGISWKNITEGDEKAAKLIGDLFASEPDEPRIIEVRTA